MTVAPHPAAPSIAFASGRAPEYERDARARSPILARPTPTARLRASSPSKTAAIGASAHNTERCRGRRLARQPTAILKSP